MIIIKNNEFTFDNELSSKEFFNIEFNIELAKKLTRSIKKDFYDEIEFFCDTEFGTYEIYFDDNFKIINENDLSEYLDELIEFRMSIMNTFSLIWNILEKKIVILTSDPKGIDKFENILKNLDKKEKLK